MYEQIRADFGFSRAADVAARDQLVELVTGFDSPTCDWSGLSVAIAAPGPGLEAAVDTGIGADVVVAASSAGPKLHEMGVEPDLVATDLDGMPDDLNSLPEDTILAIHAHGDNTAALSTYVPTLRESHPVFPTTQVEPVDPVRNVGGFTDGDRAAFIADHFGASSLTFVGWDLADTTVSRLKRRKLTWAGRLLLYLESTRDERYEILDGRREQLRAETTVNLHVTSE